MTSALGWDDARRATSSAPALPVESVPLGEAVGRVLSEDVVAPHDLPHYRSSAMDGWAVAGGAPWLLTDARSENRALGPGEAAVVATGALVPEGTHGILQSEHGVVRDRYLDRNDSADALEPAPGRHIREAGEEAHAGEIIVVAGATLNPPQVALAAACAYDRLRVLALPRVAVVASGDEVDESGTPAPGRVRDSFGPQFPALIAQLGGRSVSVRRAPDLRDATIAELERAAATADLIVTTGGTGSSASDHVRAALTAMRVELLVPRVAMRPGGPTLLARLPAGPYVLALPGNPLAALMGMLTLGAPLLRRLAGRADEAEGSIVVSAAIPGRPGSTRLLPFRETDGLAVASEWSSAAMLRGLAEADGVLIVPETGLRAGEAARVLPLPWL